MARGDLIAVGTLLVTAAVLPTPDDVTIVSPVIQLVAGSVMIIAGIVADKKK